MAISQSSNYVRRLNDEHEFDRLSSLPDAILTEILSLLPINFAAATSVLSHRWHRLWTTVTRLEIDSEGSTFTTIADYILGQLTSPKLRAFHLDLSSPLDFPDPDGPDALSSCCREVCRRGVENIVIDIQCYFYKDFFFVPCCLVNSQTLVVLKMVGKLNFNLFDDENVVFQLPNLKKLSLNYLLDVPIWLSTLIRVCPLLEDLELVFKLDIYESYIAEYVNIFGLNLKLLEIDLEFVGSTQRIRISIDAPKLENLRIRDCTSFYEFVRNPTTLVEVCVDLIKEERYLEYEEDMDWLPDYLEQMSKFVQGMSSVSKLDLKLELDTNIFTYINSVSEGFLPIFRNLVHFEMTLDGIGLSGWKDVLHSLQCFPNLKHLDVNLEGDPPLEHGNWCAPVFVPDCMVNKLKTIQIRGLIGTDDDLNLLAYILSNATVLDELCLDVCVRGDAEHKFCVSLFKLPRSSPTCEVVFSSQSTTT